jgi:flavin-dependent dehydrogenase
VTAELAGREFFAHISDEFPDFSRYSDAGWAMASQESAERILAHRLKELGADLRFGTEADMLGQDADGVTVRTRWASACTAGACSAPRWASSSRPT